MEPRCQVILAIQLRIANMVVLLGLKTRFHIQETLLGGDKTHLDVMSVPNGLLYWKRTVRRATDNATISLSLPQHVHGSRPRWGELLYGPFIDGLKDIKRLWVSPHSFLTQLPFNAIPFPDGVEREVAIIPSAASLTRPLAKEPRPNPRFTLGVVAADAVEQAPLNLQSEEVRHLRGTLSLPNVAGS